MVFKCPPASIKAAFQSLISFFLTILLFLDPKRVFTSNTPLSQ